MKILIFLSLFISINSFGQSVTISPQTIDKQNSNSDDLKVTSYNKPPSIVGLRGNGTVLAKTGVLLGDLLMKIEGKGYDGFLGFFNGGRIGFKATQNWGATNGGAITFETTPNTDSSPLERMVINHDGRVGIGTSSPTAQLDVVRGTAPDGTAIFRGTTHVSHFNYATDEHTYIRGGKNGSKVLINDVAGLGSVGIGLSNPNEILDVNGRMRIRHNGSTAGLWLSNSTNGLGITDGAFLGLENDNKLGIYINNAWRFGVNNVGEISTSSMVGSGFRMVLASPTGSLLSNFQPQVWSISGSAFTPTTSGAGTFYKSTNMANYTSGSGFMVAPVNLPTGVEISEIKVFYSDNSSSDMTIRLTYQTLQNSNVGGVSNGTVGTITTSNVTGIQSANLTLTNANTTIDNANRAYYIDVRSTNWDDNLGIYGIKITYS